MGKTDTKRELEAVLKAAEKNRVVLKESEKKVEALDAAIQAAKRAKDVSIPKDKSK